MSAQIRPHWAISARRKPRRDLLVFIGSAVLTLLLISLGSVLIVTQVARNVALRSAEDTTARLNQVVGPLLGDVLGGDAARRGELDRAVANRLGDSSITGIQVWRADGEIVYASDEEQIGQRFTPPNEIVDVIQRGMTISAIKDAEDTPSLRDDQHERTMDVYVPLQLAGQPPLAFEAQFSYEWIGRATALLLAQIIPLCIGALVLLQLVQVPIAVRLARRVADDEAERTELLERALSSSERERRQIAADLHDGLIQNLAGAGYALAALARSVPPERVATVERVGGVVRGAVNSLRRLMVDIYPPDLSGAGLSSAIHDLVAPLRERGMAVSVEVAALPPIDPLAATAQYRVAKEALTNVAKHADANTVQVSLTTEHAKRGPAAVLRVIDDGVGLPIDALDHRAEGHLGLRLLIDWIADLGGALTVHRADGRGTIVDARVPVHAED
ncbi:MAG: sensor histidine kinase [Pseudonocardiaceae bacterium]